MATDPDFYRQKAESLQAKLNTLEQELRPALDRVKNFKLNFGVREKSDGEIDVDFDKFAENLGIEQALELRSIIDEKYNITGEPGEKPKVRVTAG